MATNNKEYTLREMTFGGRVAEEEGDMLQNYFVETDDWNRIFNGNVDIVYGPKGSGKSAIYSLLTVRREELRKRDTIIISAENPRGDTAFKSLVEDPPTTENEFVMLWKLYLVGLCVRAFDLNKLSTLDSDYVKDQLIKAGLYTSTVTLRSLLRAVQDYGRQLLRPQAVQGEIAIDPATGLPTGLVGKIIFSEPNIAAQKSGYISVDALFERINKSLHDVGLKLWIALDRLDVAFAEHQTLEANALRALFKVYLSLMSVDCLRLKIFIRTDIWDRITHEGFREASHITRSITIKWDKRSLLHLIVGRALNNDLVCSYYKADRTFVLSSSQRQESFFSRIFPDQVEVGPNKPSTLDWIIARTRDGTGYTAPRELIHLLNQARTAQIKRLEIGEPEPDGERLFVRPVFKEALPEVSKVRIQQTLFAEYPSLRSYIEKLNSEKTSQTINTLSTIWEKGLSETQEIAQLLVDIGFFEKRGTKDDMEFWVPFLYRDGLNMIQGSAE